MKDLQYYYYIQSTTEIYFSLKKGEEGRTEQKCSEHFW